jgi:LmbE family N-acetylglucosaminyl deacetylase
MKTRSKRPYLVFVVAHPDDLAHSMGGTALLLKRAGFRLHVLCLTKGERGIKGKSLRAAGRIREKEEAQACKLIGARLTFLGQVDGDTFADRRVCHRVAAILRRMKPAAVFTLWPINAHKDHTTAYELAVKALHLAGRYGETELYFTENAMGAQTRQFEPDLYVDISAVIDAKKAMARCHGSQNKTEAEVENVVERNRIRGLFAGCRYAEPFKTLWPPVANATAGRCSVLLILGGGSHRARL